MDGTQQTLLVLAVPAFALALRYVLTYAIYAGTILLADVLRRDTKHTERLARDMQPGRAMRAPGSPTRRRVPRSRRPSAK